MGRSLLCKRYREVSSGLFTIEKCALLPKCKRKMEANTVCCKTYMLVFYNALLMSRPHLSSAVSATVPWHPALLYVPYRTWVPGGVIPLIHVSINVLIHIDMGPAFIYFLIFK